MTSIHATAIVGERVRFGDGVRIGPGVLVEDDVVIGDRTRVDARAFVGRWTEIGPDVHVGLGAQVGGDPQIVGWQPVASRLVVGAGTIIREYATLHRAKDDGAATVVGERCFLMGGAHIAHDCRLGDRVIVCNGTLIAGHVEIGDDAFVSGNCAIHQFVRLGRRTMIRGLTAVSKDVVPFTLIDQTNTVRGLNIVGLRRSGLSLTVLAAIKRAYREIFRSPRPLTETLDLLEGGAPCDEVGEMVAFIRSSRRGICSARPPRGAPPATDEGA
jgi:UDP-N-acetylglucosamine acyltransferase